jgi:hypothetical protein
MGAARDILNLGICQLYVDGPTPLELAVGTLKVFFLHVLEIVFMVL